MDADGRSSLIDVSDQSRTAPEARWIVRRLTASPLTAHRAAGIVAAVSLTFTALGGLLAFLLDRDDFPNIGIATWWAVQTVTTVGYGDFVPHNTEGRVIGTLVMLVGVSSVAVATAVIAAALVGVVKVRLADDAISGDHPVIEKLDEISARLDRLEAKLERGEGADE